MVVDLHEKASSVRARCMGAWLVGCRDPLLAIAIGGCTRGCGVLPGLFGLRCIVRLRVAVVQVLACVMQEEDLLTW